MTTVATASSLGAPNGLNARGSMLPAMKYWNGKSSTGGRIPRVSSHGRPSHHVTKATALLTCATPATSVVSFVAAARSTRSGMHTSSSSGK